MIHKRPISRERKGVGDVFASIPLLLLSKRGGGESQLFFFLLFD